jgi:hypothetical protein
MKSIISILFFLTVVIVSAQAEKKYPKMTFEETTINYGKITTESSGRRSFKFTNTGNAPLIIQKVKGSCGCVVLDYPKRPIMPNEKATIDIVYNVLKVGRISRTVTVTANTEKPIKVLKIKGRVLKN